MRNVLKIICLLLALVLLLPACSGESLSLIHI